MDMNFVVIDVDAGISRAEREDYAAAQQEQLRSHLAPLWDGLCETSVVRCLSAIYPARPGVIQVRLQKTVTQQGALAYHDRLPDGTPICYVFTELAAQSGTSWTSAASHEVLETACDPRLRLCVQMDDGSIWDREICDRVEASSYKIGASEMSNFNTPACFEPASQPGSRFDYMRLSTAPNQVLPGGYAQKFDPMTNSWTQVGQMRAYRAALARLGLSRGSRRAART